MRCFHCHTEIPDPKARFCANCGKPLEETQDAKEIRRKGTVLFADVSGFTALSETMDPDSLRMLMDEIMQRLISIVLNEGGSVDKVIGDCIMAHFGITQAYGDDPERALHTALKLTEEIQRINREKSIHLDLHSGLSFGLVSFGRVGRDQTVMGDTVNTASRLMSLAKDGEILTNEDLYELGKARFHFKSERVVSLKGKAERQKPYRLVSRKKKTYDDFHFDFQGRDRELSFLSSIWREAKNRNRGLCVGLWGEPRIGKTRFLREWCKKEKLESQALHFEFQGGYQMPYREFQEQWGTAISMSKFSQVYTKEEMSFFSNFEAWFDLPAQEIVSLLSRPFFSSSPQERPILILDGWNRADDDTKFLFQAWIERLRRQKVFSIVSSEKPTNEIDEKLVLKPLDASTLKSIFSQFTGRPLPSSLAELCRGNPGLLEEVLTYTEYSPSEELEFPKLELLLTAQMEPLSTNAKSILRLVSVFGNRIDVKTIAALAGFELPPFLEECVKGRFLRPIQKNMAVFRNAETRSVVYNQIPMAERKKLHRKAAEILEKNEAHPSVVADHYILAEENLRAIPYALLAVRQFLHLPKTERSARYLKFLLDNVSPTSNEKVYTEACILDFSLSRDQLSEKEALAFLNHLKENEDHRNRPEMQNAFTLLKAEYLLLRGLLEEALHELTNLETRDARSDVSIRGTLLKAKVLAQMGDLKSAVHCCMKTARNTEATKIDLAETHNILGNIAYLDGEYESARSSYANAKREYEQLQMDRDVSKVLVNQGNVEFQTHSYERALQFYIQAGKRAQSLGDLTRNLRVQISVLECHAALGQWREGHSLMQTTKDHFDFGMSSLLRMEYLRVQLRYFSFFGDLLKCRAIYAELLSLQSEKTPRDYWIRSNLAYLDALMEFRELCEAKSLAEDLNQKLSPKDGSNLHHRLRVILYHIEILSLSGDLNQAREMYATFLKSVFGDDYLSYCDYLNYLIHGKKKARSSNTKGPDLSESFHRDSILYLLEVAQREKDINALHTASKTLQKIRKSVPQEFEKLLERRWIFQKYDHVKASLES